MTATPPPRGSARPWARAQLRRCRSTARCSRRATRRHRSWCQASTYRIRCGTLKTHWRTGTSGNTWSTRCAARSAMRRPPQLGQKPRPLHENGTSRSVRQSPHWNRAKPPARNHTAETPGTRPRRAGATRRRPEAAQTRRGTSRNGRAPPYTGPTRSGLAECTRPGAHRHHGAGTVPTSPQRGVAATAGSGGNARSIRVPIGRGVMDESRASCHTTAMRSAALSAAL